MLQSCEYEIDFDRIANLSTDSAIDTVLSQAVGRFSEYADDPIGFGETILGDTYTDDVKKVMQSVVDYPVTLARSATETGKSYAAARIAVWFFLTYTDSKVFCLAAPPQENLRLILWGGISGIVHRQPELFRGYRTKDLYIERDPESYLSGLIIPKQGSASEKETSFSGKHAPHILFIIDEGNAVPPAIYRGIEGCLSGGHARLLVLFNPREKIGPVWQIERDKQANVIELSAFRHPNVIEGHDIIPGAVSRESVVRRLNLWSRKLSPGEKPDSTCFELPTHLIGTVAKSTNNQVYPPLQAGWRKIEEPALSYMVLGQYPAQSTNQLISQEWVDAARSRYDLYIAKYGEIPPQGVYPVQGLDVAEMGDDLNSLCTRYGGFVPPLLTWSGLELKDTERKTAGEYKEKNAYELNIDATGLGAGVPGHCQELGCNAVAVKMSMSPTQKCEIGEFGTIRDQAWWMTREWLKNDTSAMLPPDEKLLEELTTPRYDTTSGKVKITDRKTLVELLKRSPDRATSLALTHLHLPQKEISSIKEVDKTYSEIVGINGERGIFEFATKDEIRDIPKVKEGMVLFHHKEVSPWEVFNFPKKRKEYLLSVKTNGEEQGEEKNYFNVIEIFERGDILIQCAEYRSTANIDDFTQEVFKAYTAYFEPMIFPRVTNYDHGNTIVNLLRGKCCKVYRREVLDEISRKVTTKYGWQLDKVNQRQIIDTFSRYLSEEKIILMSSLLVSEIKSLGQMGSFNDLVITAALAVQADLRTPKKSAYKPIEMRYKQ